jgi:hypothetical protein
MAFHLEHDGEPVADVDDAGILARALDDPRRLGRQRPQMDFRGFVRAMLVPHRREDTELGEAWFPADQLDDAHVFVGRKTVFGDQLRGNGRIVGKHGLIEFDVIVMAGHSTSKTGVDALSPAIHVLCPACKAVDARHKAGHDTARQAARSK